MARISLHKNPFVPQQREIHEYDGSIIDWLTAEYPKGFGSPIQVFINAKQIDVADLDVTVSGNDAVTILVQPAGIETATFLWSLVVSVAISYVAGRILVDKVNIPGYADQPEANPVYSLTNKQNVARVGGVIPVVYGRVWNVPDHAMSPYYAYDELDLDVLNEVDATVYHRPFSKIPSLPTKVTFLGTTGWIEHAYYSPGDEFNNPGMYYIHVANVTLGMNVQLPALSTGYYTYRAAGTWNYVDLGNGACVISTWKAAVVGNSDRNARKEGQQYAYYLFSLGQGDHNIDDIKLGDTLISSLPASDVLTLSAPKALHQNTLGNISNSFNAQLTRHAFWENVYTSVEIGAIELDERETTQYFPVAGSDVVNRIALDFVFDRGFYKIDNQGNFLNLFVDLRIHVKSHGAEVTKVVRFESSVKDVSPYRRTVIFSVNNLSDVQVAVERLTEKPEQDGRVQDSFRWAGLKGYGAATPSGVYGDTHLLAMRVTASELTSAATTHISVLQRRKLQRLDGYNGKTSNPADILYDIYTNSTYGARRPDNELDLTLLRRLHTVWNTAQIGSNMVFNDKSVLFEAMQAALSPAAAEPLPIGALVSVNYSGIRAARSQLFNEGNIQKGTLNISYSFDLIGDYDCVEVEYRDPDTWQPTYYRYPDNYNPHAIKLFGVTDALHAEQYAKYLWNRRTLIRKRVSFKTELEGLIPRAGDRIGVTHTLAQWGVTANVYAYNAVGGNYQLTSDIKLDMSGAGPYYVMLRSPEGTLDGPIQVTRVDDYKVDLARAPVVSIYGVGNSQQTVFSFGEGSNITHDFTVVSTRHDGNVSVTIEAETYNASVFDDALPSMKVIP